MTDPLPEEAKAMLDVLEETDDGAVTGDGGKFREEVAKTAAQASATEAARSTAMPEVTAFPLQLACVARNTGNTWSRVQNRASRPQSTVRCASSTVKTRSIGHS